MANELLINYCYSERWKYIGEYRQEICTGASDAVDNNYYESTIKCYSSEYKLLIKIFVYVIINMKKNIII